MTFNGGSMKIEHGKTFTHYREMNLKDILVSHQDGDEVSQGFIKDYREDFFGQTTTPTTIDIALCTLGENESWTAAASILKKDGWVGASLAVWRLYVNDKKEVSATTITLPGIRYRDDNLVEWIPLVHFHPRFLFRNATEISMRLSTTLDLAKPRVVLISKIKILRS